MTADPKPSPTELTHPLTGDAVVVDPQTGRIIETRTADPKPSPEALALAAELLPRTYAQRTTHNAELQIALALDRFRAAGVEAERERCATILEQRAGGYATRQALAIYNGSLIAEELRTNAQRIRETRHDR